MRPSPIVEPIVIRLKNVDGVVGLHDLREEFDYACSKARADAIDQLLLDVFDERGWSLSDDAALDRVTVDHDGKTRARILVDGAPATVWWQDRLETIGDELTWRFEPAAE